MTTFVPIDLDVLSHSSGGEIDGLIEELSAEERSVILRGEISQYTDINYLASTLIVVDSDITDISMFGQLEKIALIRCNKITEISDLKNLTEITLFDCAQLSTLPEILNCNIVNITNCHKLDNLYIMNVGTVYISNNSIHRFTMLKNINQLTIEMCPNVKHLNFGRCRIININNCDSLEKIDSYDKLHHLLLDTLPHLEKFIILSCVDYIYMYKCATLYQTFRICGDIGTHLLFAENDTTQYLAIQGTVSTMMARDCAALKYIVSGSDTTEYKIVNCPNIIISNQ